MTDLIPLYDRLNDCWKEAEEQIKNLHISAEVYVDCSDVRNQTSWKIGWVRHPCGWGIAVFHTDVSEWKRITDCSVPVRSAVICLYPDLFKACQEKLIDQAKELERSIARFKRILNDPGQSNGSSIRTNI